ncbi:MAG: nucleoside-diphosphate kinase [Bdellovibrionia bacterium]
MSKEMTFSIIKPNAMKKNAIGAIVNMFESKGLKIAAAKMVKMSRAKCEEFYAEHKARPFFGELVTFMTSGPVLLMVLSGEGAVDMNRKIMGATDPGKADAGTIRKLFGDNVGENAVHGSDSPVSAKREIALFFEQNELVNQ